MPDPYPNGVPMAVANANLATFAPLTIPYETSVRFPAAVACTMWSIESKWGTNPTGKNNMFGLTGAWSPGPESLHATTEFISHSEWRQFRAEERATTTERNGSPLVKPWPGKKWVAMRRFFRDYPSVADAFADKIRGLLSPAGRYMVPWTAWLKSDFGDAAQAKLLDGIVRIYGTGESYPTLAAAIIKQRNIREAVAVARSASPPVHVT